ncbi:unnamed protein product [Ilex paraguariensis]|uniref:ATP-grasp domain-containing protein n=1 Tax=Ilex paraguariensis TaxID=185542 RepID=A0ABC8V319_9AQUA
MLSLSYHQSLSPAVQVRGNHIESSSPFPSTFTRRLNLNYITSSSLSWMLKQHSPPMLPCRASLEVQSTSNRNKDLPVHGVSETVVGVLGGGQLGRMLCQAASQMGIKVIVLDPMENCPASVLAHYHMVGSYDDSAAVEEFAKRCGVLTVEIEHVDAATLEKLEQQGVDCQPKASTIRIIQDKYLQKVHFSRHAIPLPKFMQIDDFESAQRAGDFYGYPLMIKSRRLAYDGRGNAVAKSEEELACAVHGNLFIMLKVGEMCKISIAMLLKFLVS